MVNYTAYSHFDNTQNSQNDNIIKQTKKGRTDKFFQITRQRARFTIRLFLPLQCLTSVFGMGTGMTTAL